MGVPKLAASVVLTDAQKSEIGSFKLKDFKAKNYLFRVTPMETIHDKEPPKKYGMQ